VAGLPAAAGVHRGMAVALHVVNQRGRDAAADA